MTFKVMEAYEGEDLSNIQVYDFEHITMNCKMCVIKVSISQAWVGFMNPRCSETPQILTTEWDIRSHLFHRRSLRPVTCSTILRFIQHHIVHLSSLPPSSLTDDVDEGISTEDSEYGSTGWPV